MLRTTLFSVFLLASPLDVGAADWKGAAARTEITPQEAVWLTGYAAREKTAQGVLMPLYAKALVLQDPVGHRFAFITADLLGFSRSFTEAVASELNKRGGWLRRDLLFNASHTHSGPALSETLQVALPMPPDEQVKVKRYTEWLQRRLADLVEEASDRLEPCRLALGMTRATFAVNRRVRTSEGYRIGVNRLGPVDHEVPFLSVDSAAGRLLALLYSYSCHCTTLTSTNLAYHGDYAGVSQQELENRYPGSIALFMTGTAGDANPAPRGTLALARQYGEELADAIASSLNGPLRPLTGNLEVQFGEAELLFRSLPSREELINRLESADVFIRRHARLLLDRLDRNGSLPTTYSFPIHLLRFGRDLTLVALAGEVVVDYKFRLRDELGNSSLWVAGYSNDVSCYIPSARILQEGGYEAEESMIYYGQPSPFASSVEETIVAKVLEIAE